MRLLHIEDDDVLASQVRRRLDQDGIITERASCLAVADVLLRQQSYAGVILDLTLPDGSGLELLRRLRQAQHAIPVLVLSGQASEDTIIGVLHAGADDYVLKPVSLELLRARVLALLRRGGAHMGSETRIGGLVVDVGQREAWADGRPLGLSTVEFNLLARLAAAPGRVYSREWLLTHVWSYDPAVAATASNVVDVTVGRVRRRLGAAPGLPRIEAVRGAGYTLRMAQRPVDHADGGGAKGGRSHAGRTRPPSADAGADSATTARETRHS